MDDVGGGGLVDNGSSVSVVLGLVGSFDWNAKVV